MWHLSGKDNAKTQTMHSEKYQIPHCSIWCEVWTINKQDEKKGITAFETKCFRTLRISWMQKIKNEGARTRKNRH